MHAQFAAASALETIGCNVSCTVTSVMNTCDEHDESGRAAAPVSGTMAAEDSWSSKNLEAGIAPSLYNHHSIAKSALLNNANQDFQVGAPTADHA